MSDAPETIWAMAGMAGKWSDAHATNNKPVTNTLTAPFVFKYTRTDHSQALIAAAYEAAGKYLNALSQAYPDNIKWCVQDDATAVLDLTPADAKAAYDKAIADAERRGMERAAVIVSRQGLPYDFIGCAIDAIRAAMEPKI
jgi:hypothetical protein